MKKFDAILYDLDGTLIHLPQERFVRETTALMAKKISPLIGIPPQIFVSTLNDGINAMIGNDGSKRNDETFFDTVKDVFRMKTDELKALFDSYYKNEFRTLKKLTTDNPFCRKAIKESKRLASHVIVATLPVFPRSAQDERLDWGGMKREEFDLVTDYTTSNYSKPSPGFYVEILRRFRLDPTRCLMVGNDVSDDILPCRSLGMQTFLVTDCLLNGHLKPEDAREGSFEEFTERISSL